MGDHRVNPDNSTGIVFIRIAVPELKVQKCLQFQLEHTVWQAKQRVLASFAKDLRDALNYGLYLPPANGRAGKFMEEERLLSEYPIQGPIGFLEFKYKRRVYKLMQINERKLKQIHSKTKLKQFMEFVQAGNVDKINKLTIKGLDPNFHDHDNGETPLTVAVTLGRSRCREVILALVGGGAHLDYRNKQGLTALHRAAIIGNADAIRAMLDLGASPDYKDSRDLTPLYYSVTNDDAAQECTLMLLHERARVGICDQQGWYEIHQACKYGRIQHLEHLVFYGADMDVRNSCGNTPLHICALHNQEACARLLLFRGADPSLCNYNNQTADQAASLAGNFTIAAMINKHNPDDVVPYREIPQYSDRRKGASLTPSLRALLRSRSDPRINVAGLDSRSTSNSSSPYGDLIRRRYGGADSDSACSISVASAGSGQAVVTTIVQRPVTYFPSSSRGLMLVAGSTAYVCTKPYVAKAPGEISLKRGEIVQVTGATDHGMYEGRTMTGREGYFPGGHLSEVNIRRAGSVGDVNNASRAANQRNTLAPLLRANRESQPRVVLLHRSPEGYGFVLRGAKSKVPTGGSFNDFTPSAEYPALQYLDSVDPESQADRAGLRTGDFILEINGENVVRASHEHVVHLIRSSSDVLTLKVVTVTHSDPNPGDWHAYQDSGAMTLPSRKKIAAPLPPQRDPQTSLSYSRGNSKSMTDGLAEIEKLDATIAEFDGEDSVRSHSIYEDQKVASVRASHALKRVSVMDYEGLVTGEPSVVAASDKGTKGHASPAEARIKKYHKRSSSQTIERSKSTPDISVAVDEQHASQHVVGQMTGSWAKRPNQNIYRTEPYSKHTSVSQAPDLLHRSPATSEIVRINTAGRSTQYGNIVAEIENRKKMESQHESSFRPENNDALVVNNIVMSRNPELPGFSSKSNVLNETGDKNISFADDKVAESAHRFVQKYPNASLLITADVHSNKTDSRKDRMMYEPEPDYDNSDDEKSVAIDRFKNKTSVTVSNSPPNRNVSSVRNVTGDGGSTVRPNSAVTVISITSDVNKESIRYASSPHSSPHLTNNVKSSPVSIRMNENTIMTSPAQSLSSSRRSSGVIMTTPSQPSSAGSSRRSSIQSNFSGDNGDKNGRSGTLASTVTISNSRNSQELPPPPPPPLPFTAVIKPVQADGSANTTLKRSLNEMDANATLSSRVSADDILAAVAERQSRLETDGPRVSELKSLPTSKSSHELNQEALKVAIAKRKSRLEQVEDEAVVNDIEARLNRSKKLQAAKFPVGNAVRNGGAEKKEDEVDAPTKSVTVTTAASKTEEQAVKPKETTVKLETLNKNDSRVKMSPVVVPFKSNQSAEKPFSERYSNKTVMHDAEKSVVDFRSMLKPVDVKVPVAPVTVQSKTQAPSSVSATTSSTAGGNVTTIVMTKAANSSRVQAATPPPPPPPVPTVTSTVPSATPSPVKPKTELPVLSTSKTAQNQTEKKVTNPLSPTAGSSVTSPSANSTPSPTDYIALAERARQEYLKKRASGNLPANIEKKGPIEITPNKKNSQRNKPATTTSPAGNLSPSLIKTEIGPVSSAKEDNIQVSVQDRIKILQSDANGKTSVAGVTVDHSHTEASLSNGTIKKSQKSNALPPLNMSPPPPPPGFGDNDGSSSISRGLVIDIIPPPSSFNTAAGSPDSALNVPSYSHDDTFVSSVSSHSTLSSEHGNGKYSGRPGENIKDLIAHSPPPPPDFGDISLGDQDAFIPPPPEFLEIDSNGNESKTLDKNSKPFANKPVSDWSCMDVLDWLDSLNLPQYRIGFAKARVDGSKLVSMGRNDFMDLGVTQVAHRMNLERSVKKLNIGASTDL